MSLASEYLKKNDTDDLWSKLKHSTKQLSSKPEKDGDSPTSTVVHEALVRYYKKQEPFQGFPGWLGHKEELPDEQKILKKQTEQLAKQSKPSKLKNLKEATSEIMTAHSPPIGVHRHTHSEQGQQRPHHDDSGVSRRKTAGMGFRSIYQSKNNQPVSLSPPENVQTPLQQRSAPASSTGNPYANMSSGPQNHRQTPSWASSGSQNSYPQSANVTASPQSSSDLMSARLKRRTGRTPF